jgi:hypothetical protein
MSNYAQLAPQMAVDLNVFDAQGFASVSQSVSTGSTLWGAHHMPQNRDAVMLAAGDGSVSLWKYQYPDQRKVKVGVAALSCWQRTFLQVVLPVCNMER